MDPEEFLIQLLGGLSGHLQSLELDIGGSTILEHLFRGKTSRVNHAA
jgi:hypothetical protein